jgi:hypothetical protein
MTNEITPDERVSVLTALSNYNWTITNCVIKLLIASIYEHFNSDLTPSEIETVIKDYYKEAHNIALYLSKNDPTITTLLEAGLIPGPISDESKNAEGNKLKLTYNKKPINS